jgi:DNA gyrase/topoisomerase IV subunit B
MNPTQLWDTTMNPETRQLLQVTIEDAEKANEITNLLMGDIVKPRQDFIIDNSTIATLDI